MDDRQRFKDRKPRRQKHNSIIHRQTGASPPDHSTEESYTFSEFLSAIGNKGFQQLLEGGGLQAKLNVSSPGDFYEQQADRFAEEIMEMGASTPFQPKNPSLDKVQPKGDGSPDISVEAENQIKNLKGKGSPLSRPVCDFLVPRLGTDVEEIRVHTDEKASHLAKSINAKAFTYKKDIVFAKGEYQPQSQAGMKLIAHEVAHVFQQTGGIQRQEAPSPEGTPVNSAGIVYREYVNMRSRPDTSTSDNILKRLNFNTVFLVLSETSSGWSYIRTQEGEEGYVASNYIKKNLPEPNAKLHRIEQGESAIGIAEQYYKENAQDWGQDLRYFVNVLVHVNQGAGDDAKGIYKEQSEDSWEETKVRTNYLIWIPSVEFAKQLVGQVKSGSISYDFISGMSPKIADFVLAFKLSGQYIPGAIKEVIVDPFVENIVSIAIFIAAFLGLTMLFNFIGGVGGAIGILILNLIGLGFMVTLLFNTLLSLGETFIAFFQKVWSANGDRKIIEEGAKDLAKALALLLKAVVEGILTYFAAKGVAGAYKNLMNTQFGRWFEQTRLYQWLQFLRQRFSNNVNYMRGNPVEPSTKSLGDALNPEQYAYKIAKKYNINLRGSGQNIKLVYDSSLPPGQYGLTRQVEGGLIIRLGPSAFTSEATLANTIAHELNHCRAYLQGSPAHESPAYNAGDSLESYILGER